MINKIKIILVRHGQSIGNQTRVFLGHTDLDLSELGYKQANATAEYLKNEKIDNRNRRVRDASSRDSFVRFNLPMD